MSTDTDASTEVAQLLKRKSNTFKSPTSNDYPDELNKLLQPFHCLLCSIQTNSISTARLHYDSKNHQKRINYWLAEWAKRTGAPCPKLARLDDNTNSLVGPNAFHCDICDLDLTSYQHAAQHYAGRRHHRKLIDTDRSGSGSAATTTHTGIDGGATSPSKPLQTPQQFLIANSEATLKGMWFCKLCDVTLTSNQQLTSHLNGQKHGKRLKRRSEMDPQTIIVEAKESIISGDLFRKPKPSRDTSVHRTPSGDFYCPQCDVTVTNESLLNQHLDSKRHRKQAPQHSKDP